MITPLSLMSCIDEYRYHCKWCHVMISASQDIVCDVMPWYHTAMWRYRYIYDVMPWYHMWCHAMISSRPMSCAWYRRFTNTCFTFIIKQLSIIIIIYHKTSFSYSDTIYTTTYILFTAAAKLIISSISPHIIIPHRPYQHCNKHRGAPSWHLYHQISCIHSDTISHSRPL